MYVMLNATMSFTAHRTFRFNEAMATIRRSPAEHHFHLVITRVFEDGDQELLEDEAESESDNRALPLAHTTP